MGTSIPIRQYRDYDARNTFVFEGVEVMKLAQGDSCSTGPKDIRVLTFNEDQWLCEY